MALTWPWVDYPALAGRVLGTGAAGVAPGLSVDEGPFAGLLRAGAAEASRGVLTLTLHRGPGFPTGPAELEALAAAAPDLAARLAVEALARGYLRCELHDGEGRFLGVREGRLKELWEQDSTALRLALPPGGATARVTLGP